MSIKDRIHDAELMATHRRMTGALLSVLVAVAATARKRYPRSKYSDADSFKKFLAENMRIVGGAGVFNLRYRGTLYRLEEILYKFVRCELAHEGEVPFDIKLTPAIGHGHLQVDLSHGDVRISEDIIDRLATSVIRAQENAGEFTPDFSAGGMQLIDESPILPFGK